VAASPCCPHVSPGPAPAAAGSMAGCVRVAAGITPLTYVTWYSVLRLSRSFPLFSRASRFSQVWSGGCPSGGRHMHRPGGPPPTPTPGADTPGSRPSRATPRRAPLRTVTVGVPPPGFRVVFKFQVACAPSPCSPIFFSSAFKLPAKPTRAYCRPAASVSHESAARLGPRRSSC
jgi:hypothetical protein